MISGLISIRSMLIPAPQYSGTPTLILVLRYLISFTLQRPIWPPPRDISRFHSTCGRLFLSKFNCNTQHQAALPTLAYTLKRNVCASLPGKQKWPAFVNVPSYGKTP
jgi:hypothetical protein